MHRTRKRQQGLGVISNVLIIILVAAFALAGFKVAPYYLESYKVKKAVEGLKEADGIQTMTPQQIRKALEWQLYIEEVPRIKPENVTIRRGVTDVLVDVTYEIREHLVANIDLLLSFQHKIELDLAKK